LPHSVDDARRLSLQNDQRPSVLLTSSSNTTLELLAQRSLMHDRHYDHFSDEFRLIIPRVVIDSLGDAATRRSLEQTTPTLLSIIAGMSTSSHF